MPFTYPCAVADCDESRPTANDLIEHAADDHGFRLRRRDIPAGTFVSQVAAQGGTVYSRPIACRRCANPTHRTDTDPIWRHVADDTPACVDPDTMRPYTTVADGRGGVVTSSTHGPAAATRTVATDRAESDPCERGTDGCYIAHGSDDGTCETW